MKHLLLTTIAAVLLVGCTATQHSADVKLSKPVVVVPSPQVEANTEADNALIDAAQRGSIESVKQHLDAGADVNAKDNNGGTPLDVAIQLKRTEIADLLRKHGGKTGEELK